MKILLINPPDANMLTTEVPTIVSEERGHNPPLGLMYIAAQLKKSTDHEIKILDANLEANNHTAVESVIRKEMPDIIGITMMTFTLIDCIKVARTAKKIDSSIKVIVGGVHPNIYPNETISLPEIDYIVLGEGESTVVDLIQNLDLYDKLKGIKGLVFKKNKKIISTGLPDLIQNLDEIPFPDRSLTPYKKYSSLLAKRSPITTMITSRGCPYRCLFCNRPHLGKIFRKRSANNVVDEMQLCLDMGIKEIIIYDDTFTINRARVVDICNEIIRRKIDIGWDIRARVNTVDRELLAILQRAGCERIHYGVESGNQHILNVLRKDITLEQVERAFKLTKKAKIGTLAYFMIGSPRENKQTILQSINFAKKLKPDFVHFSITTPFPDTHLYELGLSEGIFKKDHWKEFASNPTNGFKTPIWEENLNEKELLELLQYAYKSFYTRPSYMLHELLKIRNLHEFKRKAKAGLKILKL